MRQVDEVRAAADIVRIVGEHVKLRKAGVNLVGLCPFHQEKTPSFAVHPVKQIFHCFGCGVGGDVFKFVMLMEHLTFPEALRRLAEKVGVRLRETEADAASDARAQERAALYRMHEAAAHFFATQLSATTEGRAARAYLADRGLGDQALARFRIGYAPSDGQALARRLAGMDFDSGLMEKSGLVVRAAEGDRRFDRFRRRVMFPIANEGGRIVAFGGRALGEEPPKYLNSPETPIYSKSRVLYNLDRAAEAIRRLDRAVLVEGYMDCIAVASAGVENVVASCGTSLTESQVRLLGRHTRRAVVNYDPDSAGMAATERSLGLLLEEGFEVQVLVLPPGLDPDAFIRHHGAEAYRKLLDAAPSYLDYLADRAAAAHGLDTPQGRVAAANAVLPYLARLPSPLLRAAWAARLAERLRLDDALLREELKRSAARARPSLQPPRDSERLRPTPAERDLLRACLENPALAAEFLPRLVAEGVFAGLATERLMQVASERLGAGNPVSVSDLEPLLSEAENRILREALLWPGETPERERVIEAAFKLKAQAVEREMQAAKRSNDLARVAELMRLKAKSRKELTELWGLA
jgi:DNA primase